MYDVIVIGAGPSGMMACISARENNKRVLLIEKNNRVGIKLELTGGGRCNLTNLKSIDNFIKEIPVNNKFLYSAITKFGPEEIYKYFKDLGVDLKVEDEDRVFPTSNKSKNIIDALYNELIKNNVEVHLNESVLNINSNKEVTTNKGIYKTKNIIIATGGMSYPQTGSIGDGYRFAKSLNQNVTNLYPAETFLITSKTYPLAGISLDDIIILFNKKIVSGSMLFTHNGISGPAVFKISEEVYKELKANDNIKIYLDLIKDYTFEELFAIISVYNQKKELVSFVREYLPKRLVDYIVSDFKLDKKIGFMSKKQKEELIKLLKNYEINIKGTGSLEQSFITGGGVNISNINSKTMESNINRGIYFIGEVLDVHGHTGGYNITIALSTGYTAGSSIK